MIKYLLGIDFPTIAYRNRKINNENLFVIYIDVRFLLLNTFAHYFNNVKQISLIILYEILLDFVYLSNGIFMKLISSF
jgi:hypothetical protein